MYEELTLYAMCGYGQCISVSENFITMESDHPLKAVDLEEMLDRGWVQLYPPILVDGWTTSPVFHQTFTKQKTG